MGDVKNWLRDYLWYIIVGAISLLILLIFPFIGSSIELGWAFPETSSGWFLYVFTKVAVTALNLIILYAFRQQAKLNVRDDPNYKQANELYNKSSNRKHKARDPATYLRKTYITRGISCAVSTVAGLIALGPAILVFDYVALISYFIVILIGVLTGLLAMKSDEVYWTTEYLMSAQEHIKEEKICQTSQDSQTPTPPLQ